MKVQQHWAMSKLIGEEMALIDGIDADQQIWMKTLTKVHEERMKLEEEILEKKQEEVLQGYTVSNQEVRNNWEDWKAPIDKELSTLLENGAISPITKQQRDELVQQHGTRMECIPSKIVAVVKAGGKKKARLVACGNYATTDHITAEEKTASGTDIVALRMMLRVAAHRGWEVGSLDVKGAFLLAPRRKRDVTVLKPPAVLLQKGVVSQDTLWSVNKAVYGLVESPADWSDYRDKEIAGMQWKLHDKIYELQTSEETNMWLIKEVGGDGSPCGYLATYVDDMLMVGPQPLLQALMTTIANKWECSSQEFAEFGKDLRFCGMEIRKTPQGFDIHQSSYVMDLLARYEVAKTADVPMGKVEDLDEDEEEKPGDLAQLRQAQQLAGELIWVSTRTRVDIAFAVGAMSRRLHRDPTGALRIGEQILSYLRKSPGLGIQYSPCEPTEMDENQVPRMMDTIEVFADVSYAPGGEAYRSIQGVLTTMGGQIIQWHTGRQSLIATSTAEGELLAYQEGQIMGASVESLAQAMALDPLANTSPEGESQQAERSPEEGEWKRKSLANQAYGWYSVGC